MTHRVGWCLVLLACVMLTPLQGPAASLVLLDGKQGRVLTCLPLEPGEPFSLEFINSIYLAPVKETLVYEPAEGIMIVKVESPSAGVFEYYGLEPDGSGQATLRRPVGDIRLRTMDYVHHRLTVGERRLDLKGLVPDGEPLVVKVLASDCGR
jgi:hypothetical protein